jgi:hypothetical protein
VAVHGRCVQDATDQNQTCSGPPGGEIMDVMAETLATWLHGAWEIISHMRVSYIFSINCYMNF